MEEILQSLKRGAAKREQGRTCVVPLMPGGPHKDDQGRFVSPGLSLDPDKSEIPRIAARTDPVSAVALAFQGQRNSLQTQIDNWLKDIKLAELEANRLKVLKASVQKAIDDVQEAKKLPEEQRTPAQVSMVAREEQATAKLTDLLDKRIPANNARVLDLSQQVQEALEKLEKLRVEEEEAIRWNRFGADLTMEQVSLVPPEMAHAVIGLDQPSTSKAAYVFDGCEIPGKGMMEKLKDIDGLQAELCRNLKRPSLVESAIVVAIIVDIYSYVWNLKDEVRYSYSHIY